MKHYWAYAIVGLIIYSVACSTAVMAEEAIPADKGGETDRPILLVPYGYKVSMVTWSSSGKPTTMPFSEPDEQIVQFLVGPRGKPAGKVVLVSISEGQDGPASRPSSSTSDSKPLTTGPAPLSWVKRAGLDVLVIPAARFGNGSGQYVLSPSGRWIAYTIRTSPSSERSLGVLDVNTGKSSVIFRSKVLSAPVWSPEKDLLAWFASPKDDKTLDVDLYVHDARSGQKWTVAASRARAVSWGDMEPYFPTLSWSGKYVIFREPDKQKRDRFCDGTNPERSEPREWAPDSPPPPEIWKDGHLFADRKGVYKWITKDKKNTRDYVQIFPSPFATSRVSPCERYVAYADDDGLHVAKLGETGTTVYKGKSFDTGYPFLWLQAPPVNASSKASDK